MSGDALTNTPKLGFGLMRLPRLEDGQIDVEQTSQMVDMFLDAGLTYFDTAYVYEGSEEATRKALVERHPRDSYTLASKINARLGCVDAKTCKAQLQESLRRTGAGYLDYYLLHALQTSNRDNYDRYGIWDFVREQRKRGVVRHVGFSFHDSPRMLDELLTLHPEVDFVQLQINYADWESPTVFSRENYEVARSHGKPVVVMEPVKGGRLANPPREVAQILRDANPHASLASWAIRFAASLDGVMTVLSGMSTLGQVRDNVGYMADFHPLDRGEREAVARARRALAGVEQVPCTACRYCVEGCPRDIPIPDVFEALNQELLWGNPARARREYAEAVRGHGGAGDCIGCRRCEGTCPQHIEVTSWLRRAAQDLA
jgi:predicted aldo/keto reductase-like oxidoreductase